MMNLKLSVCALAIGAMVDVGLAANLGLVAADADWSRAASFTNGAGQAALALPGSADDVYIPEGFLVEIDSTSTGFNTFAHVRRVVPMKNSEIAVNVPAGANEAEIFCAVQWDFNTTKVGTLVKRGPGSLQLSAVGIILGGGSTHNDYYVPIRVEAGTLKFPHNPAKIASANLLRLDVWEGATLWTAYSDSATLTQVINESLTGAGVITNANVGSYYGQLMLNPKSRSSFSGVIAGNLLVISEGDFQLLGTKNSFLYATAGSPALRLYGNTDTLGDTRATGVLKLGCYSNACSSVGRSQYIMFGTYGNNDANGCGRLLYLGTGEKTNRRFTFQDTPVPAVIDAGVYGGLEFVDRIADENGNNFVGYWTTGAVAEETFRVVLTGSNTTPCSVACQITGGKATGATRRNPIAFTKQGTGTWRFIENRIGDNGGAIAVENGALEFDTMRDVRRVSALGYSTACYEVDYNGPLTDDHLVPYAFLVGGDESVGDFRYVGTNAMATTRPLGVKGHGRLSTAEKSVSYQNVFVYGDGAATLDLDAPAGVTNYLANVSEGTAGGTLKLCKTGAGVWRLKGDLAATGGVAVDAGTLEIENPNANRFSYFRFVVKELGFSNTTVSNFCGANIASFFNGSSCCTWKQGEIALYDAAGNRQNTYLKYQDYAPAIQPGQAAMEYVEEHVYASNGHVWNTRSLFDESNAMVADEEYDKATSGGYTTYPKMLATACYGNSRLITPDRPESWMSVVMRLTNNVDLTHYDLVYVYGNYKTKNWKELACNPTCYSIDGSIDGVNWENLLTEEDMGAWLLDTKDTGNYYWLSDNASFRAKRTLTLADAPERFKFTRTTPSRTSNTVFAGGLKAAVAAGATLKAVDPGLAVTALEVDAAKGCGTLDGFALAADGEVTLTNVDLTTGASVLPLGGAFANVEGLANVKNWTLSVNGQTRATFRLKATAGGLTLYRPGTALIFR